MSYVLPLLIISLSVLIGFVIHEFMHALVADKLGDNTPRLMGRLSLNPLAHLDLFGTIFLLIAHFGWGKPVIINPKNFKNPKLDNVTVALSGPMSNFGLALIAGLILRFSPIHQDSLIYLILSTFIFYNLGLMIFNFLPIPPLDGSKLLSLILPEEIYAMFEQIGFFLLIGLVLFSSIIPIIPFIWLKIVPFFFTLITGQPPLI